MVVKVAPWKFPCDCLIVQCDLERNLLKLFSFSHKTTIKETEIFHFINTSSCRISPFVSFKVVNSKIQFKKHTNIGVDQYIQQSGSTPTPTESQIWVYSQFYPLPPLPSRRQALLWLDALYSLVQMASDALWLMLQTAENITCLH